MRQLLVAEIAINDLGPEMAAGRGNSIATRALARRDDPVVSIPWDEEIAAAYGATSAAMSAPDVLGPTVDLLSELAAGGPALERPRIGTVATRSSPGALAGC